MNNNNNNKIIVICGPTASGKTSLAVGLAKEFNGEIISADAMQVYKNLNIATAKPSEKEKQNIPHHLMDFLDPRDDFSVAGFIKLAEEKISYISEKGKLPIICGGTGLYIDSLISNTEFDETGKNEEFRAEMRKFAQKNGNSALLYRLRKIDPEYAEKLHENNISRIIRALEVYKISGKKMSEIQVASRRNGKKYNPLTLAINLPRDVLYQRINSRVDEMISNGLINEAREFFTHGDYQTSSQAIGYKELKPYLDNVSPLESCVEKLKQATRNYAKRQLTWFRKNKDIHWIENRQEAEILVRNYLKPVFMKNSL